MSQASPNGQGGGLEHLRADQPSVVVTEALVVPAGVRRDEQDVRTWCLRVVRRGQDSYVAADSGGRALSRAGAWDHEPLPSSRTERFVAEHHLDQRAAMAAAQRAVATLVRAKMTWTQVLALRQAR